MNSRIVERHVTALKGLLKPVNLGVLTSLSRDTLVGNQARARDIFQQHSVADIHYHVNEEEALEDADDVSDMLTAMDLLTTPDHLQYLEQASEDSFDDRQKTIIRDMLAAFAPGINPSPTVASNPEASASKASPSKASPSKASSNKDRSARPLGSSAAGTNVASTVKRKRRPDPDDIALRRSTRPKASGPEDDGATAGRKGDAADGHIQGTSKPLNTPTWAALRQLRELELHPVLASHLDANPGCSPHLFLEDVDRLLPKSPRIPDQLQGITALYMYNKRSTDRSWLIHARFLFVILFFGDYADQVLGEKGRLSKGKARDMVEAYYRDHRQDDSTTTAEKRRALVDEMVSYVPNYIKWGKRVVHLCDRFTTGSLFWLCPQLTEAW
ncbi:MAG: hypothetical protein OHK93_005020 [Ramalina farinacea]|uniref:Uncharacterized protein n=1 Tax=Ramalina farinacea TaxID=258253 RepID=A0AA43U260_9LECA|nr:hypothetical protein [Ramalina farinacea]